MTATETSSIKAALMVDIKHITQKNFLVLVLNFFVILNAISLKIRLSSKIATIVNIEIRKKITDQSTSKKKSSRWIGVGEKRYMAVAAANVEATL
jgi:hypothetical protein